MEINAHNTKFNILATRAKFHDEGNLARLYLRSLNPAVRQRYGEMRLLEEVARRRSLTLPDLDLRSTQASVRSISGILRLNL